MEKEIWKDVVGYEGYYQVSNTGYVKNILTNNILKNSLTNGYFRVCIKYKGKQKTERTHRLIAKAFIPNPENKPHINHKNGIRNDNRLENLEWCTNGENQLHGYRSLGRVNAMTGRFGKNNPTSKMVIQKKISGENIKIWYAMFDIERELGFARQHISECCRGKKQKAYGFKWSFYHVK